MRFPTIAALAAALLPVAAQAEGHIVLALSNNYPPLMTAEGGVLGDIIDEAVARVGGDYTVEIQSVPWSRAVVMVENGQAHGLVGTYYRPEARPWISAYSEPLMQEHVSVFCKKGVAQASWSFPDDFKGLKIEKLQGSAAPGSAFFDMVESGLISMTESPNVEISLKKLNAGRVDCYVNARINVDIEMDAGKFDQVEYVTDVKTEDSLIGYLDTWTEEGYAKGYMASFDEAVKAMHEDGTIEAIIAQHVSG